MQDELVVAMTVEELLAFKELHAGNETIVRIVDGAIAIKQEQEEEAKRWIPFHELADETLGTLPDYTPNWRLTDPCQTITIFTIEVDDISKVMEEVEVNGEKVMRYPKTLQRVVRMGGTPVTQVTAKTPSAAKGGECYKRNKDGADTHIGHFATCSEACKQVGVEEGKGSACKALETSGYYFTKE